MKFHPSSEIFPLASPTEFESLKEDIRKHGLREPIWICDGMILDGRNRYRACLELGIEPKTRNYTGDSPTALSWSYNGERRNLTTSQKAAAAVEMLPMFEAEAKARQAHGQTAPGKTLVEKLPPASEGKARDQVGKIVGVSGKTVSEAKKIKAENPEKYKAVQSGEKTIQQVKREIREEKREQRRQENREKVAVSVDPVTAGAKFSTIVIDPPWDWGDEGDVNQLGRAKPDYSTLTIDQLLKLPVGELADDDCHIYLWITNRSLPKGFSLLDSWGFRYITCLTWVKPNFGMGNYFRGQSEQVLFGVRGSQQLKRKDVGTVFTAPRGPNGHSSKPVEFYDLVESCSPGPFLEMFSRSDRNDWTMWGEDGIRNDG